MLRVSTKGLNSFLINFWQKYFIDNALYFILDHNRKHLILGGTIISGFSFDHLAVVVTARYFLWKGFSVTFKSNLRGNVKIFASDKPFISWLIIY